MVISWLGAASVRIATSPLHEEVIIVVDPFDPKALGLKRGKLAADVVLISTPHHPLHNAHHEVRGKGDQLPFVMATPGECELKGAMWYGIPARGGTPGVSESYTPRGGKDGLASPCTLFLIASEGITLLHLGLLKQGKLTDGQLERFEHVDVLFVPAGDPEGLTPVEAAEIVGQIEPRIIIPISYDSGKGKGKYKSADKLIKELGLDAEEPIVKFKLAKKDLPAEETRLILLTPD